MPKGYHNGKPILGMLGRHHSKATRRKMSDAQRGKKNHRYGKTVTQDHRDKISRALQGCTLTTSHRRKIGQARLGKYRPWLGRTHSKATKEKMRLSRLGWAQPLSVRRKINKSMRAVLRLRGFKDRSPSKSERAWGQHVEEMFKVRLEPSVWIDGRCFDFRYKRFLFELDGRFWHSQPHAKRVDRLKNQIALQHKYTLIRFPLDNVAQVNAAISSNKRQLNQIFGVKT